MTSITVTKNGCTWCSIQLYYMDNSVLPKTKTLAFAIFSLVTKYQDVRARHKKKFPPVSSCLFSLQNMAAFRVFIKIFEDLVKFQKKMLSSFSVVYPFLHVFVHKENCSVYIETKLMLNLCFFLTLPQFVDIIKRTLQLA